jgi:hypothetical protein
MYAQIATQPKSFHLCFERFRHLAVLELGYEFWNHRPDAPASLLRSFDQSRKRLVFAPQGN